jgi:hypothetical protein
MTVATVIASLVLVAGTAAAQPGITPASPLPPASQPVQPSDDGVSERAAVWISGGATLASYAVLAVGVSLGPHGDGPAVQMLGAAGTLIAPSTGRWYAHAPGLGGIGLRLAGVGVAAIGASQWVTVCPLTYPDRCEPSKLAPILLLAGAGLYLAGTIHDIASAPGDARRYNQRLHNVSIAPIVRPDDHGLGVAVAAQF